MFPAQGKIGQDVKLWAAIVGIRGNFRNGEGKWAVPYYFDVGTGSSDRTWQAMVGLEYSYAWGELMLVYRHLYYDEGSDGLMTRLQFR